MTSTAPTNASIAGLLDRIADLLEAQEENPFRVRSYRNGAAAIRSTRKKVAAIALSPGAAGLTEIDGIGAKLAGLIVEFVTKGRVALLDQLEKEAPAEASPAAGKTGVAVSRTPASKAKRPGKPLSIDVGLVLAIDAEYRTRAKEGKLKRIAPKLLNPERKAWLPLMVTESRGFRFTVMFSNTSRAHELGKTNDWVVVYYEKGTGEHQCTVVTEQRGALKGKRVIRGREKECQAYYD